MSEIELLVQIRDEVRNLSSRLDDHCRNHPLEHHDHLMDLEEHAAHHAEMDKPKDNRKGERRGEERRKSTEKYDGEERRSA